MKGEIKIKGLRLRAFHGVGEQEQLVGNIFEIDVTLTYPIDRAVETDDVTDTLSYADIVDIIKTCMSERSRLLEHVAGRIHSAIIKAYPIVCSGTIEVRKLTPPLGVQMQYAAVSLSW